ncbi:ABC transporter substrate-binding protein [Corynebacterium sp. ES2794-CONJ1]|uniref:ABC transporter substrate-binding protein n=1 Tax=unclassified Corynebacterium TaxID=2624378 RepID=UPI0021684288|nr:MULTISPECIES: ABC transporter substrate-binding protein [unclassified Corynebacterium]MCS4489056.1 ABC transporter substrate-binding protein [Corynebacterium sp. ES2775-CONJ]MCS4490869.1 ABC transporter substrate-binding protein [Corynebacterium sp. ES2715-CONJ3]MCS4531248.1 ABC transporter substrate-binding protein [Corynebacterium sp. ES2730-CONJ]MCU9518617.1 ABC transporter substrate-binding protein [Corynebacterium sp. ES2794-CONJ1]
MAIHVCRILSAAVVSTVVLTGLSACSTGDDGQPSVYFLNFKPEQESAYQKIAAAYTAQTGVPVKIETVTSGNYENALKTEVSQPDAPTLFQLNGPTGLKTWQHYTADLSDIALTAALKQPNQALRGDDGKVYGVPFAVEGYGIIYNEEILDRYFAMPGAQATSAADIRDYTTLKAVADDMQSRKETLGIDGVFSSTSLKAGEDWRWQTHLANIPMYYEFRDAQSHNLDTVVFKYNANFKKLFDLYLNNSTVDKTLTPTQQVSDSMTEFALGKSAMVQNGTWGWSQVTEVEGSIIKPDKVKFLPLYTGMSDDPHQGLAVGTENYLAVNAKAPKEDQQASIDFINWLFTSDAGKKYVIDDLGFIAPFKQYAEDDTPDNPLAREVAVALSDTHRITIPWVFQYFPSQQFKDDFGLALTQYATGRMEWSDVVSQFVESWAAEKNANT